jgi:5-oxoprolinase (ATP-hydrolysing) subunit C
VTALVCIDRAGPLTTIQDDGRHGHLAHGISASGPMDRTAFALAGRLVGTTDAGIEFTRAGLDVTILDGEIALAWAGGDFLARRNGKTLSWPGREMFRAGDRLTVEPGAAGNYGYLRFGGRIELPPVLGSRSTSTRARIGGLSGRPLTAGDALTIRSQSVILEEAEAQTSHTGPIRFIWGIHAHIFAASIRQAFTTHPFEISPMMDRMGVRLIDRAQVFAGASILSLVSDPIMPGDIQILGDGTPIVLMRDHQPTGGYPRIGTVVTAHLDRFAQLRPGSPVAFSPISVDHAHRLMRSGE